ncbi:MAG: FAD-dependent oxidoreductase, partial [Bacteroidales bacterium]|nr:FAD-dependent oxidoreductase [Bacteroidales bacterium]
MLIIGGGITGAGTAMAAAKTGLKTLLIDKNDFAYGTSSRSSKMIHGGLRYLQQMNFALVKESLTERELLMKLLPNQVFAQEYVYPVYEYSKNSRFEVKLGMIGYDLLAGSQRIGHHHHWTPDEFAAKEPAINREKLTGGFVYHDCLVDDSRLTLAAIQSAAAAGVECLSYFKLEKLKKQGDNWALKCHDELDNSQEYSFNAAAIINA